jgi:hypothetical protein
MPRSCIAALLCTALLHGCGGRPAQSDVQVLSRIEHERSLAAVASLPSCGDAAPAPREWVRHDAVLLSFQLPPGYHREETQGFDSFVGSYVAHGRRLSFDYGAHSSSLNEPYSKLVGRRACRVIVNEHLVRLVTARTPEGAYFAGAAWREISPRTGGALLTMVALTETAEGQREALAIFRSVMLKHRGHDDRGTRGPGTLQAHGPHLLGRRGPRVYRSQKPADLTSYDDTLS